MRKQIRNLTAAVIFFAGLSFAFPAYAAGAVDVQAQQEADIAAGPGAVQQEEPVQEKDSSGGVSAGSFKITGYCSCSKCTGGHTTTYAGTTPQPNHTISADLNLFPLGTRLMINGTVYTVEDKGSAVQGNKLDIYYASHNEALNAGTYTAEVFVLS